MFKGYSKKLNKMFNVKNFIVKDKKFYEVDKLYQYIGRVDKEGYSYNLDNGLYIILINE